MKKNIIVKYVSLFLLCIFALVMMFALTSCQSKWTPEVQGSQVLEMPYESIDDDFMVEKYVDFSSFSKSKWASYNFISQEQAKNERYSKEYFKKSDLIIVKFNMAEKGIDFTVTDVVVEGNICTVELLPVKHIAKVSEQQTTYCCFVETTIDISTLDIKLKIQENIVHESKAFSYISDTNKFYTFDNQTEPVLFVIDGKEGIEQFFDNDGVLSKQSYIFAQLSRYSAETFSESSLMLVRLPSSDFEQLAVYYEGNTLHIVGAYSNHYLYKKETKHHKLVALLIPKDLNINMVSRTIYYEYEDNLTEKINHSEFSLEEQLDLASNLKKYSFVNKND